MKFAPLCAILFSWGAAGAVLRNVSKSQARTAAVGRGTFSQACTLYPGKRVVLVTVNSEYLGMFKNWLHFASRFLKETEQLRVVAEDEAVIGPLKEMQKRSPTFDLVSRHENPLAFIQAPWATDGFGKVVWDRPGQMFQMLEAGCSVLYNDIDTVWVNDPFIDIQAAEPSKLYLTDDAGQLCTCFMYVNPDVRTTNKLIREWGESKATNNDQGIFNGVFQKSGVQSTMLPRWKFPPGKDEAKFSSAFMDAATVLHANWRVGIGAKIDFMKKHGFWDLEEARHSMIA